MSDDTVEFPFLVGRIDRDWRSQGWQGHSVDLGVGGVAGIISALICGPCGFVAGAVTWFVSHEAEAVTGTGMKDALNVEEKDRYVRILSGDNQAEFIFQDPSWGPVELETFYWNGQWISYQ